MLDIQLLRNDLASVVSQLAKRGYDLKTEQYSALEAERKLTQTEAEALRAKRNSVSKQIGVAKSKGEDVSAIMAEVAGLGEQLFSTEQGLLETTNLLDWFLLNIPNLPHESVPIGKSELDNVEVRIVGEPRTFDFEIKDHTDVGTPLGLDFDTGIKLSGTRFTFMRSQIAKLHRALAQFMIDTQTEKHGYEECYTPYLVNAEDRKSVV